MYRDAITISELTEKIIQQLNDSGYEPSTQDFYRTILNRLCRLAVTRGDEYYTCELGQAFINDDAHIIPENTERYHHERTCSYKRVIQFIESYLQNGVVDWTPNLNCALFPIKSQLLQDRFSSFIKELKKRKLSDNTIDGYRRFTYYFIEYLENKGYTDISELQCGDVVSFISVICTERYQATSLNSHLPGLKIFLSMDPGSANYLYEVPCHLPKKRDILEIYSDEEYRKIIETLEHSDTISLRNKAITILALNTGLRAADICCLKLSDIDWDHNCIRIVQQKTKRVHLIPLTEAIGNSIVDYLLNERPDSTSEYVFLRAVAPYNPLMSHAGIRKILFDVINDSDIECKGRVYGTRITRHSAASRMLRKGIPLPVISEMLGHGSRDAVMIYITTDNEKLAECTLPLPKVSIGGSGNA